MTLNESKRQFCIPKFDQKYFKQGIKNVNAENTLTFSVSSSSLTIIRLIQALKKNFFLLD
jgi:hypothetical protein